MRWKLDENNGDIIYEAVGDLLILKIKPSVINALQTPIVINGNKGTESITLIKSDDTTAPTDENVFSALRTLLEIKNRKDEWEIEAASMFLRKDIDDTAHGNITFDKKIKSSVFLKGWDGKGWEINADGSAIFNSESVRSDIFLGGKIGSPEFVSGFTGSGWQIDQNAHATFDYTTVRKSMKVYELVYSQIYGLGGSVMVTDLNKIKMVTPAGTKTYTCEIDLMDNVMRMNLRSGDIVRMQRSEGVNVRYFYGQISNITNTTFDLTIIDGEDIPEAGDIVFRIGNISDTTRQGLLYLTSSDDYSPYLDVLDGVTNASFAGKTKVRLGNLQGITINGYSLSGYGIYLNGGIFADCTYYLADGSTLEQKFEVMNGKLNSEISSVKNDLSLESGNILKNSSFGNDTDYWRTIGTVHFINVNGSYLYQSGYFYVDKAAIADIYTDGSRNVLRIRNNTISQLNTVMSIPTHSNAEKQSTYTYSFALYYKVLRAGTLTVGFSETDLYATQTLEASDKYQKLTKVAQWNETGDFTLAFTGEILIYGVSLFHDALADTSVRLSTQIQQTASEILLRATKEYVDTQDGSVKKTLESSITVQADRIAGVSSRVTSLESASAGWITEADGNTLWATASTVNSLGNRVTTAESSIQQNANNISLKVSSNGVISAINQSPEKIKMSANKIEFESKMITANNYFKILADGSMQAINGDFSGKITAMSGTIGGLTLASDKMIGTGFEINSYGIFFTDGTSTAAMGSSTMGGSGMNPMIWIQDTAANARDGVFINFPNAYTTGGTAYNNNAVKIIGDIFTFGGMCNYEAVTLNIEMSNYYNHRQVYVFYPSGTTTPTKYLPSISSMYNTNGSSYFYVEYVIMVKDDSPASILLKPYGSDIFINTQSGNRTTIKSIEIYPRNIVKVAYCLGQWYLLSTTNNVTITNN